MGRYQGADIACMVIAGIAVLAALMPWSNHRADPFQFTQARVAFFVSAATIAVFALVPHAVARKVVGMVAGAALLFLTIAAINTINRSTTTDDFFSFVRGDSVNFGLVFTLLLGIALFFAALAVKTRPQPAAEPNLTWTPVRTEGTEPYPAQVAPAWPTPATAPPPQGTPQWRNVSHERTLRCPRCATSVAVTGAAIPSCPRCGFSSQSVRGR